MSNAAVRLTVSWGYEPHSISLTSRQWTQLCAGQWFTKKGERYQYEGEEFQTVWIFNDDEMGSLRVTYSSADGSEGDGFVGALSGAVIEEEPS